MTRIRDFLQCASAPLLLLGLPLGFFFLALIANENGTPWLLEIGRWIILPILLAVALTGLLLFLGQVGWMLYKVWRLARWLAT